MASSLDSLRMRWEGISEREQRLIAVLGITFVVVIVVWVGMQIDKRLTVLEQKNAKMRKALSALQLYRADGGDAQTGPQVAIPKKPVKLQTYLEGIAEEVGVKIPGFNPRPPQESGKYTENSTRIEIRKMSIGELAEFLQKVEGNPVVVIKALNIRQHFRDREKLDVRMDVATYFEASAEDEGDGDSDSDEDTEG